MAALLDRKSTHRKRAIDTLRDTFTHLGRGLELDSAISQKLAVEVVDSLSLHILCEEMAEAFVDELADFAVGMVGDLLRVAAKRAREVGESKAVVELMGRMATELLK